LVDRIHRTFPIRADYHGMLLSTNMKEHVSVEQLDGAYAAWLD
jgi:pyrimidine operon attenuation protein/uracil phosphoribosyltransferase